MAWIAGKYVKIPRKWHKHDAQHSRGNTNDITKTINKTTDTKNCNRVTALEPSVERTTWGLKSILLHKKPCRTLLTAVH